VRVYLEIGKKAFASAADWPGWSRGGKSADQALDSLLDYGERYARAVAQPVGALGPLTRAAVEVVERLEGNATTDFGAPGVVPEMDRQPVSAKRLDEMIELLRASWQAFEKSFAEAGGKTLPPAGPRGGGRTLDGIRSHVVEAQAGYLNAVGGRVDLESIHQGGVLCRDPDRAATRMTVVAVPGPGAEILVVLLVQGRVAIQRDERLSRIDRAAIRHDRGL